MSDRLTRALARTHVFFSRLSHASLFRREETRLENARFSRLYELEQLAAEEPATDTCLLLGVGPYRRVLRVRPTPARRELGNMLAAAPTRGGKGLLAVSQLLTWPGSVVVNDIKGELYRLRAHHPICAPTPTWVPF
jgi:type IV secretory pathway TraG/TraD family ATPase VirD4